MLVMVVLRLLMSMILSAMAAHTATALEILRGEAVQGGLVILQLDPGSGLTVDGSPRMVTPDGLALVGFHRDDTDAVRLEAKAANGTVRSLVLTPRQRQYKEQRIDGLPGNMVTPPQEVLDRIARDRQEVQRARGFASALKGFSGPMAWPLRGTITGVYGSRRILNGEPRAPHYGIDIAAPKGAPVTAPADGIVRMVDDLYFTGWTIILDHGHGLSSTFLHLDEAFVEEGQRVRRGERLAAVGSSGRSTGPHLDWRINLFEKRLDPMLIAGPMPE